MPVRFLRHPGRALTLTAALVAVALVATACSSIQGHGTPAPTATGSAPSGAYTPALARNAEYVGQTPLTDATITKIAENDHEVTLAKFDENYSLAQQFEDATKIVDAGKAHGNPGIKVYLYVNSSFWYDRNTEAWGSYADGFQQSWLLKGAEGTDLAFAGKSSTKTTADDPDDGGQTRGNVVDLSNAAYRSWLVSTVKGWLKQAPIAGFFMDSANLLVGDTVRADVAGGTATWNALLCGSDSKVGADGNCSRVDAWNAGLATLLSSLTHTVGAEGGQIIYNGVAPSPLRTADRNQELFADAPTAANEDFCWGVTGTETGTSTGYTSMTADIAMMKTQAAAGRGLLEITNYKQDDVLTKIGGYCVGGFLMGWAPGLDYLVLHRSYGDSLSGTYPQVPETNLALGAPTAPDVVDGSLLTRTFAHGFVAVDTGTTATTVTTPESVVQFVDGKQGKTFPAGAHVTVDGQGATFFLTSSFVATL